MQVEPLHILRGTESYVKGILQDIDSRNGRECLKGFFLSLGHDQFSLVTQYFLFVKALQNMLSFLGLLYEKHLTVISGA